MTLTRNEVDDELRRHREFLRALVEWMSDGGGFPPAVSDVCAEIEDFLRIIK